MGTRAWKKFKQLDTDNSGALQGDEVKLLADWVWHSFHPNEEPTATVSMKHARERGGGI